MAPYRQWRDEIGETVRLALPITIGQVGQMLMGLTDSMIVGHLGAVPLAAVAFSNVVLSTLLVPAIGVLTSVGVIGSREHGARNVAALPGVLQAAFWLSLLLGACLSVGVNLFQPCLAVFQPPPQAFAAAEPYLSVVGWSLLPAVGYFGAKIFCESLGRATAPMWFLCGGVLLNLVLALSFVFGWGGLRPFGLVGAGWATLISRWFTFGATLLYALSLTGTNWRTLLPAGLDRALVGRLLRLGLPVAFQYLAEIGAFNFGAVMMGWLGTAALAAHQIAISCAALTFMFPLGISQAVAVRVGHAIGRRALRRVPFIGFTGLGLSAACMLAFAGLLSIGRHPVALAFGGDPQVTDLAGRLLLIAAAFQLADGVQVTAAGALRGLADVRAPMLLGYVFYWGIAVPLAYVLAFSIGQGARGIWMGLATGLMVAAVTLTGRFFMLTRPDALRDRHQAEEDGGQAGGRLAKEAAR